MTDEQKSNIDKVLSNSGMSKQIGGATDVSGPPKATEPMPLDKAKDIGQDLHKAGVTMDK